jgi:hypothetical protein
MWLPDGQISSAAFNYDCFSVELASRATRAETFARLPKSVAVAEFRCGLARGLGFDARDEPEAGNDAHANVYDVVVSGRKRRARQLADQCSPHWRKDEVAETAPTQPDSVAPAATIVAPGQPAQDTETKPVEALTDEIQGYDRLVKEKATRDYPATKAIQSINGVGALTALAFVLVLNNDPERFRRSRDVGCYVGLRPKQRESGMSSPQLRITKAGDPLLRRLATQSAQYILGPFGRDSVLRGWGLGLASRGGKNAKKRAIVAVARKLVILMHRLWITQEECDPMRGLMIRPAA